MLQVAIYILQHRMFIFQSDDYFVLIKCTITYKIYDIRSIPHTWYKQNFKGYKFCSSSNLQMKIYPLSKGIAISLTNWLK